MMKTPNTVKLLWTPLVGGVLSASPIDDPFEIDLLAFTGDKLGTENSFEYITLDKPVINLNGEVCFKAQLLHQGEIKKSLVKISQTASEIIALSGELISPWKEEQGTATILRFADFGNPDISDISEVTFRAKFEISEALIQEDRNFGIVRTGDSEGEFWVLDRTGRSAKTIGEPGTEQLADATRHLRFSDPVFDGRGGIYYSSLVQRVEEGTVDYRNMIYHIAAPSSPATVLSQPNFVFRGDAYLPDPSLFSGSLPGPVSFQVASSGDLRVLAQLDQKRQLIRQSGLQKTVLLESGDELVNAPSFVVSNIQADSSQLGEFPSCVVTATNGSEERQWILGLEESNIPAIYPQLTIERYGMSGEVSNVQLPISAPNGATAFVITFDHETEGERQSLWRELTPGIDARPVAMEGEQAPESPEGVTFRSFGSPLINGIGQVVFPATLNHGFGINSQNDFAIYIAEPNRSVCRIIGEGDMFFFGDLELKKIESLVISDMNEQGELAISLQASDGSSALIKVEIPPRDLVHFDKWAIMSGLPEGNRSRLQDSDGDGHNNLLEYAYGSDPLDPSSFSAPQMRLLNEEGVNRLALEFTSLAEDSDVTYLVEFSDDLQEWTPAEEIEIINTLNDSPDYNEVRTSTPEGVDRSKTFVRIQLLE